MNDDQNFKEKMQLAVLATGAIWIADIGRSTDGFQAVSVWGDAPKNEIGAFLLNPDAIDWLEGVMTHTRTRTRKTRSEWGRLGCSRLFSFPSPDKQHLLLVGTNDGQLEETDQALMRALIRQIPAEWSRTASERNGMAPPAERMKPKRTTKQIAGLDITELDFESVLRQSVQRSREIVGGTGAELGLLDQRNDAVRVLWSEVPGGSDGPYLVPLGSDVIGQIAKFGRPLWVNDYSAWPDRTLKPAPYEAIVGVPLRFKGSVIGTLTVVDNRPGRQFTEEDARLLEVLASQIAISIRNARLFEELGRRIKAQRAAESKMVEAARLAAIGEMAASVAHELNNPLTAICGFSELLMDEFTDGSRQRENMELVLSEARRARDVVRRLLDFSRREADMRSEVNINEAVSQVLALVQPMAATQAVEIQFEAWEDLPLIYGDRSQIRQVLLNLVANGIQAMPQGGYMHVATALSDEAPTRVAIRVQDRGIGIPMEFISKIFDPFFTTKPVGSGTGLGLSISRNIIMDHGGEIRVDSQEGEGTCFTVLLPVHDANLKG